MKGAVAERIAEGTWNRLREAQQLRKDQLYVRLGEETLTDLLVLDFLVSAPNNIKFVQTTKPQEAVQGTDLVVCVRRSANRADVYAVQAKRLGVTGRYDSLKHRSGNRYQINVLEDYARRSKAIPLYLLFNHVDDKNLKSEYWRCCQQSDKKQFGCTLVPSWRIRDAISKHGCRTFDYIHSDRAALPWRCAFDCPNNQTMWGQIREKAEESRERFALDFSSPENSYLRTRNRQTILPDSSLSYDQYEGVNFSSGAGEWPDDLWERGISPLSDKDMTRLHGAPAYQVEGRAISRTMFLPRWIMLVNSDDS